VTDGDADDVLEVVVDLEADADDVGVDEERGERV
jgi:hypothetical protein